MPESLVQSRPPPGLHIVSFVLYDKPEAEVDACPDPGKILNEEELDYRNEDPAGLRYAEVQVRLLLARPRNRIKAGNRQ